MKLFALQGSDDFGELVAKHLGIPLSKHEEKEFEDGEHKVRPLENIRNQEVFVIHSLYSDARQTVNDKLCRLLFFISTLKDASARKVIAVIPYLCYSRKDRRTKPRDPVTTRYVARLLECAGAGGILTIDVHNLQAFQNSFSVPAENIEARNLFAGYLAAQFKNETPVIMSPDFGGVKRAEQFLQTLGKLLKKDLPLVVMEKYRSGGEVWGERIAGDVSGKIVIMIDDLISTGATMARAAAACQKAGATQVLAAATHGLFTGKPHEALGEAALQRIITTNTVSPFRLKNTTVEQKVTVLDASAIFAAAIKRIYEGGSIVELMEN